MKFVIDTHNHSISSGHAYSTVQEMAREAKENGIQLFALTDHGPMLPGAPHLYHLGNLRAVPSHIYGVRILKGVEANIVDYNGNLDVPQELLERLEIVLAGFHGDVLESGTKEQNTQAFVSVLKNPAVDIIVHPGNPSFEVDIEEVVKTAKEYGKFIEINNSSFYIRTGSEVNCRSFVQKCKEYGTRIACGSDSHISFNVGRFDKVIEILKQQDFPEELILNTDIQKIEEYLIVRKKRIQEAKKLSRFNKDNAIQLLKAIVGENAIIVDEPMKNHTSFRIGGPADLIVLPKTIEQVKDIVKTCKSHGFPLTVIGNGTNLIVRDGGIRGVVMKIYDNLCNCKVEGEEIHAQAGILLSKLASVALQNELTGLEFASGIPGTLGGAVVMNAGAYGPEMKEVVQTTEYITEEGEIKVLRGEEHCFGYRKSCIQINGGIVLTTILKLKKSSRSDIQAAMDDYARRRREKQPLWLPSAGSVFRRPEGFYAGKLIEDCGLKGYKLGGAQVSDLHAGFIVNIDNATARDVLELINHIQASVKNKFGVELVTEVKVIGEQ